jgi:membrane protein DedA with SNARE-associated domain
MSAHTINDLLSTYGCALVFAVVALQALGAPLPGTTVLIAAAVLAATHHNLPILGVIAAGAAGALAGTTVGFAVGRWGGERILAAVGRRTRVDPERITWLRGELATTGSAWLFAARFITGLRNVAGLLAGASGMAPRRFAAITAAAALTWALVNGLEYYWFGRALAGADTWVQIVLVCLGLAWMALSLRFIGRRALRRISASSPPA